jgi:hypothetical protein
VPDSPAPAIARADAPAPHQSLDLLRPASTATSGSSGQDVWVTVSNGGSVCSFSSGGAAPTAPSTTSTCTPPTPEQTARLEAEQKRWLAAVQPAAGSTPRTVATLSLAGGGAVSFVAWKTSSGSACWITQIEVGEGGGGGGPNGPCSRDASAQPTGGDPSPCDALCLDSSGGGDGSTSDYVLAGTVPLTAEAIRVTLAGGARATYPLVGPELPGWSDRRIFILDLGHADDWRTLELVQAGAVVRTERMPAVQAASQDCSAKLGMLPHPTGGTLAEVQASLQPYLDQMNACVRQTLPSSQARPTTTP